MVNEHNREAPLTRQQAYEPPRAMRLGHTHVGTGGFVPVCEETGSGAQGDCGTGNSPTGWCFENGNSAESCRGQGSSAGQCLDSGNDAG